MTLWEVSQELSRRLVSLFTRRADGTRPVYGGAQIFKGRGRFVRPWEEKNWTGPSRRGTELRLKPFSR
jgi:hypothetical protein